MHEVIIVYHDAMASHVFVRHVGVYCWTASGPRWGCCIVNDADMYDSFDNVTLDGSQQSRRSSFSVVTP
jgi:hypothetical protein